MCIIKRNIIVTYFKIVLFCPDAEQKDREKGKEMRNWKKWLAAVLTAAVAGTAGFAVPAGAQSQRYQRWDTVAEEERIPAAYAKDKEEKGKIDPKAWKKINGVCYNGSGKKIPGAITRGIDISEWQGRPNWKKIKKSDVDFAFVRISYGTVHMDKSYDYNMLQAEEAGIPVGTYVYSLATTTDQALEEAKLAINKMDGYKVSYPVVFDLEDSKMGALTRRQVSNIANTFCEEIKRAGYYPMVYTNTNWYDNEVDWETMGDYDVWLARYGDKIPAPSHEEYDYTIWQCTDGDGGGTLNPTKGLIDGIDDNVDLNFGFVDYTKIITPRKYTASGYKPSSHPAIDIDGNEWGSVNGWKKENGKTYYYVNNKKVTGVKKIDGKYYRFNTRTGAMYTNRRIVDTKGNICYYGADGARYTDGFHKVKSNGKTKTYYFSKSGIAKKGWATIDGKKYYFYKGTSANSGTRAENITLTSSKNVVSVFDKNGVCIKQYKKKS